MGDSPAGPAGYRPITRPVGILTTNKDDLSAQGIHLGLNGVDPAHCDGPFSLGGRHNDANEMATIAGMAEYQVTVLHNAGASVTRFLDELAMRTAMLPTQATLTLGTSIDEFQQQRPFTVAIPGRSREGTQAKDRSNENSSR